MLTYDIQSELLQGEVGNQKFHLQAVSGGGRGSKRKPEGDELIRSWSFWTKENEAGGVRGGIIPPGFYICRYVPHHSTLHRMLERQLESDCTTAVVFTFMQEGRREATAAL
jgi:hypothetical protein